MEIEGFKESEKKHQKDGLSVLRRDRAQLFLSSSSTSESLSKWTTSAKRMASKHCG